MIHTHRIMYGIFTYIYHENAPNVGKYTIHGFYAIGKLYTFNKSHRTSRSPAFGFAHLLSLLISYQAMQVDLLEGCLLFVTWRKNKWLTTHNCKSTTTLVNADKVKPIGPKSLEFVEKMEVQPFHPVILMIPRFFNSLAPHLGSENKNHLVCDPKTLPQ